MSYDMCMIFILAICVPKENVIFNYAVIFININVLFALNFKINKIELVELGKWLPKHRGLNYPKTGCIFINFL